MRLAFRYLILGFALATAMQLFADPPAWVLITTFVIGVFIGSIVTIAQMYFTDLLEKHGL